MLREVLGLNKVAITHYTNPLSRLGTLAFATNPIPTIKPSIQLSTRGKQLLTQDLVDSMPDT